MASDASSRSSTGVGSSRPSLRAWSSPRLRLRLTATTVGATWLNDTVQEELVKVVEAAGLTLDKANNTQLHQAIVSLISSQQFGLGPNLFLNPGMRFWQRGTSFTFGGGFYTAGRWVNNGGTAPGSATIT